MIYFKNSLGRLLLLTLSNFQELPKSRFINNLQGNTTVPSPMNEDPKATILSLCLRLLNSPK